MSDSESTAPEPVCNADKFREYVREWIRIHDRLAEIRKDTAVLNKRKKEVGEKVIVFMKSNDKELCNLGDQGSLHMKTQKSSLTLKKNDIERLLQQFGNTEENAQRTAQFLMENKTVKERNVLKRSTKMV